MRQFNLPAIVLVVGLLAAACTSAATPTTSAPATSVPAADQRLIVFAAASLTYAFSEIGYKFKQKNPGVTFEFNYAGSQQLRTQLEQGAVADVFASANTAEMNN